MNSLDTDVSKFPSEFSLEKHKKTVVQGSSFYSTISTKIRSCLSLSMAFFVAAITLNRCSFSLYLRCRRTIVLLSKKQLSKYEEEILQKNFALLLDSALSTNFWVQKNIFFPKVQAEEEAVLTLQRIFKAWKIDSGCAGAKFLQATPIQLKNLYDCLKFYETCEKYKKVLPIDSLFPEIQKIGKDVRLQLDAFKNSELQNGRKLIFHQRSSFALLGASSAVLDTFNIGLRDLHVAFIENNVQSKKIENRHVTFSQYKSTPLRDLELIGSDILEMDIMKLIPDEIKKRLSQNNVYPNNLKNWNFSAKEKTNSSGCLGIVESSYLNEVFAEALRVEQAKAAQGHIKNNTWTRVKTLFVSGKTKKNICDYPLAGSMQCCCFVAIALFRAVEAVNKECQKLLSTDERIVNYPFDPYTNPEGLTPSSLKKLINPMCRLIQPCHC